MFYFPHTGVPNSLPHSAESNRQLIHGFLHSANSVINPGGEIHLAVKTQDPYKKWGVDHIIDDTGLAITNKFGIDKVQFPDYVHRTTLGSLSCSKSHCRAVSDKDAVVYTLEPKSNLETAHPLRALCSRGVHFRAEMWHTTTAVQDDALWDPVCEVIAKSDHPMDKHEILRHLNKSMELQQPIDTKQLNRVLTSLITSGALEKHAPVDAHQTKPRYSVQGVSATTTAIDVSARGLESKEQEIVRRRVLEVLRCRAADGGESMGALEVARSIGLATKRTVNHVLYDLLHDGLIEKVPLECSAIRWHA